MRTRLLRGAIILCLLIVTALLAANRYPDQLYHSWEWARGWGTVSNDGLLPRKEPSLTFIVPSSPVVRKVPVPLQLYSDMDGYEVFEAWLGKMWLPLPKPVWIETESFEAPESSRCFPPEMQGRLAGALNDFAINNAVNWRFEFGRTKGHYLGSTQERGWSRSAVEFSAVGFNQDRTLAVLYATYICGGRCARATYYLLEKHNGQWDTVTAIGTCGWIS
jgi:hypothetical protein